MWFSIDPGLALPIYLQIVRQVEDAIDRGAVVAGDRLPSVRDLAVEAAVNPNTVARSYRLLEEKGLVETRRGAGTFVRPRSSPGGPGTDMGAHLDRLLDMAGLYGIDDREFLRIVERRVLGRRADRKGEDL